MALESCTLCRGTGWKLVPRPDGAAGSVAVHCDFESYVTDLADGKTYTSQQAESLKWAKLFAQSFVRDYPGSDQAGLLFMGNSGVGKTHLAIAALKELIRRGHSGYFCEYGALLREIQQSYSTETEATEMRLLAPILSVDVLVIDDLGCIKPAAATPDIYTLSLNDAFSSDV